MVYTSNNLVHWLFQANSKVHWFKACSTLPPYVHVKALTATTTLRNSVMATLSMREAVVIGIFPDKGNIKYAVVSFISLEQSFRPMIDKLAKD